MVNVNSLIKKYQGYFSSSDNDRLDTVWNFADGTRVLDPVKESLSIDKYELVFIYALALRPEIPRAEAILEEIGGISVLAWVLKILWINV